MSGPVEAMWRRVICALLTALLLPGWWAQAAPASAPPEATPIPPIRLSRDIGEPSFDLFDRYKGLGSGRALKVLPDRYGFVWVGGNNGLHRFDGQSFYTIDRDPNDRASLASRIALLLADTSAALWIGNEDGVLQRLDRATGRLERVPIRTADGQSPVSLSWMGSDVHDALWMQTDLGLLRFDPAKRIATAVIRRSNLVAAYAFTPQTLFVAAEGEVMAVNLDVPQRSPRKVLSLPGRDTITALAYDRGGLWLAAGTQLWRWETANASLQRIATPVPMLRATDIVIDRQGVLWLASNIDINGGLYRLDPRRGELSIYHHRDVDSQSLRYDLIWSLALDRNNDLWIGTRGGVNRLRLRESGIKRIGLPGSPSASVCAIDASPPHSLLVSLCGEALRTFDPGTGQWQSVPADVAGLLSASAPGVANTISGLLDDGEGGVWIGGGMGLVHWPRQGSPQRIPLETEPAVYTTAALLDEQRRLWVITHTEGLALLSPGAQRMRRVGVGAEGVLTSIAAGANGSLWLGSENGLIRYWPETGQTERFRYDPDDLQSLSDDHVQHLYRDSAGRLWIGTRAGLNRLVERDGRIRFRRYGIAEGLPDQTVEVILRDASGELWLGTDRGIARWQPKLDRFQGYTFADGIPDDTIRKGGAVLAADGALYFGTSRGLWRLEPDKLRLADPVPVVISSYEAGDTTFINHLGEQLKTIKAHYNDGRIAFRLAGFGEPRRLSYRLIGLEDQWRDMPENLSIAYHRLPPGDYQLQVRQRDGRGQWVPGLALAVAVAPPLWRTWWAYLAYIVLAAAWIAWLVRSYAAKRRHRNEYLRSLRERDERLRLAMSASGAAMIEIDFHSGQISQAGESDSAGATRAKVTGIGDYLALVHPDEIETVERSFEALRQRRERELDIEFRRRGHDEQWIWFRLRGQFIERPHKHDVQEVFIGMIHDISQERSYRELRQRGEFLAVMSHEIRTPLNGVVGTIDLLDHTRLGVDQRRLLDTCKESTSVLLSIINDFLDLSKIDAGKLELECAKLSTRDLVEIAASALSAQARKQQIDLDIHVAPEVPAYVMGDWVRMRQILANLIGNAIKFTEHGGVEVILSMDAPERLRLTVADTGIGMEAEGVQRLFQPFQQASAGTTRRFGGTGLGLSIVKSLAEAMGGRVECESRVGVGTRLSVIIPAPSAVAESAEPKPLHGMRVLVIARDHDAGRFVEAPLCWLGAQVEFATTAEAAIARLQDPGRPSVDAVLIGKREPANAHIAALRDAPSAPALPIVVIDGDADTTPVSAGIVRIGGNPLTRSALMRGFELARGVPAPFAIAGQPVLPQRSPEASAPHGPVCAGHSQPILVAEDNPINREVLMRQLAQLGYACDTAEDGEEAWQKLRLHPGRYPLLITDGQMPRLDGYRLAERIRKQEEDTGAPRLKILLLTASVLVADRERGMALGMDGLLTKPVTIEMLRNKLFELLAGTAGANMPAVESASAVPVVAANDGATAGRQFAAHADSAPFSSLLDLFHGDAPTLRRLLDLFVRTTNTDLLALENAVRGGDRKRAGELAHKLKSACFQLGQNEAGRALEQVERAAFAHSDDVSFIRLVDMAQQEVRRVQGLAEDCALAPEDRDIAG
ncbi:ATP-binding protein [Lysobacter terrae]